jgi:putative intracellular protease/amidase
MSQKVLLVLTSHNTLGNTRKETGFYLPELTHPEAVFSCAGLEIEYVSSKGGKAPMIAVQRLRKRQIFKQKSLYAIAWLQVKIQPQRRV